MNALHRKLWVASWVLLCLGAMFLCAQGATATQWLAPSSRIGNPDSDERKILEVVETFRAQFPSRGRPEFGRVKRQWDFVESELERRWEYGISKKSLMELLELTVLKAFGEQGKAPQAMRLYVSGLPATIAMGATGAWKNLREEATLLIALQFAKSALMADVVSAMEYLKAKDDARIAEPFIQIALEWNAPLQAEALLWLKEHAPENAILRNVIPLIGQPGLIKANTAANLAAQIGSPAIVRALLPYLQREETVRARVQDLLCRLPDSGRAEWIRQFMSMPQNEKALSLHVLEHWDAGRYGLLDEAWYGALMQARRDMPGFEGRIATALQHLGVLGAGFTTKDRDDFLQALESQDLLNFAGSFLRQLDAITDKSKKVKCMREIGGALKQSAWGELTLMFLYADEPALWEMIAKILDLRQPLSARDAAEIWGDQGEQLLAYLGGMPLTYMELAQMRPAFALHTPKGAMQALARLKELEDVAGPQILRDLLSRHRLPFVLEIQDTRAFTPVFVAGGDVIHVPSHIAQALEGMPGIGFGPRQCLYNAVHVREGKPAVDSAIVTGIMETGGRESLLRHPLRVEGERKDYALALHQAAELLMDMVDLEHSALPFSVSVRGNQAVFTNKVHIHTVKTIADFSHPSQGGHVEWIWNDNVSFLPPSRPDISEKFLSVFGEGPEGDTATLHAYGVRQKFLRTFLEAAGFRVACPNVQKRAEGEFTPEIHGAFDAGAGAGTVEDIYRSAGLALHLMGAAPGLVDVVAGAAVPDDYARDLATYLRVEGIGPFRRMVDEKRVIEAPARATIVVDEGQRITPKLLEFIASGKELLWTGSFEAGQKFFYEIARALRGKPDEVLSQLRRVRGLSRAAVSAMSPEFLVSALRQGTAEFRFADLLYWDRREIGGRQYSFEHVHADDVGEMTALHNRVVEKELSMSYAKMRSWIQNNPRTLVARDEKGRIAGFIFVSFLNHRDFPWNYERMTRAHRSDVQTDRNTMVDFWVVTARDARGIAQELPLQTEKLARWMGIAQRHGIAFSRPAFLEEALITDEFEALGSQLGGMTLGEYVEKRKQENRLLPLGSRFPGADIDRYIEERLLLLTRPNALAIKDSGETISYEEYLALLDKRQDLARKHAGLKATREAYEAFTAPRGVEALLRYPDRTLTVAQFCERMGRVPEERVLIGLHQQNGAVLGAYPFLGRPEDYRSVGRNYLMFYWGKPFGPQSLASDHLLHAVEILDFAA